MRELQYCEILKTNINVTNMQDTLAYIGARIDALRGSYICVSNVHTTVMSYESEHYRTVQNSAAMALPDGGPLSKYSRFAGFRNAERVTGPDLMVELFRISAQKGYRHFFTVPRRRRWTICGQRCEGTTPAWWLPGCMLRRFDR